MNKTTIAALILFAGAALRGSASGDPITFTNAVIQGGYKCTLTAYTLPSKAGDPFPAAAFGDMTGVSDGHGRWTSGTWDHTIDAPGLHAKCKLSLESGTYSINPDGTGVETVRWKLVKSDSAPDCLMSFPDTGDVPSTKVALVVRDPTGRMFYGTSINSFAILATACEK